MGAITKKVAFSLTDSGTIVEAVENARLRLVQITFTVDDAVDVTVEGTDGTDILPLVAPSTTGWGACPPPNSESGIGPDTQVGEGMKITLSAPANIRGAAVYQEIG